jgi:hypothetical protein
LKLALSLTLILLQRLALMSAGRTANTIVSPTPASSV